MGEDAGVLELQFEKGPGTIPPFSRSVHEDFLTYKKKIYIYIYDTSS
jgi:hypothetical protein